MLAVPERTEPSLSSARASTVWERARLIDNEAINFANTLAGALFAIGLAAFFRAG